MIQTLLQVQFFFVLVFAAIAYQLNVLLVIEVCGRNHRIVNSFGLASGMLPRLALPTHFDYHPLKCTAFFMAVACIKSFRGQRLEVTRIPCERNLHLKEHQQSDRSLVRGTFIWRNINKVINFVLFTTVCCNASQQGLGFWQHTVDKRSQKMCKYSIDMWPSLYMTA